LKKKKVRSLSWLTAVLLLCSGALVSLATWQVASIGEQKRVDARFGEYFSARADLLAGQMYEAAEALYRLRSKVGNDINRDEFRTLSSEALLAHSSVSAVEWVPRVTSDKRALHERRAQAEGFSGYRVRALDGRGQLVAAPPKTEYFPVLYVQPHELNRNAVGLDLSSERHRNIALKAARGSGNVVFTDPLDLVQGAGTSKSFLAVLPLYGVPGAGFVTSPSELAGFLVLVIRGAVLLEHSLLLVDKDISFQLVNLGSGEAPAVISSSADWDSREIYKGAAVVRLIGIGGQRWRLMGKPTRSFLLANRTARPLLLAVGVMVLWSALGSLVLLLGMRSQNLAQGKHERTLAGVVQSLTEGVVVANSAGRMTAFNAAATRIVGVGLTEDSSPDWSSEYGCYLPDMTTMYQPERLPLVRAVAGEEIRDEEMFIRDPGTPEGVWISVNGSPLVDDKGVRTGGVIAFRDITERKTQEEKLRLLFNAVEQTADMVFISDRSGKIEYVNPAFEVTTGYTREEAVGQSPRILKSGHHDLAHYQSLWNTILSGEVYRGMSVNRKKNGQLFYAEQTITPIRESQGQVVRFVSLIKDVTESIQRRQREVEMGYARQVQQNFYPERQVHLHGLEIAGSVFPASATCGDYFDHFQMPDGSTAIVVGDVCGHGLGPALIMAETRAYLRSLARTCASPVEILEATSDFLHADLKMGSYVTLLLVAIDAGSGRLVYTNAGHTSGYLLDRCGAVKAVLESGGFPLGMFPKSRYASNESLEVQPGDLVVLSTDGITESLLPDGSAFEMDGLLNCIRAHIHESAVEIVDKVHQAICNSDYSEEQQADDITLAICRVGPLPN
jgi:PAS domain S-box-containing protein